MKNWFRFMIPALVGWTISQGEARGAATVDFGQSIQPLLARHCFACHGPDEHERKAGLRLDLRESAITSRKSGAAIVPGQPGNSALLKRIESQEADFRMPPPSHGEALSQQQQQLLREWISQGAPYSEHWAFSAPLRPSLPPAGQLGYWVHNPVDAFIAARLNQEDLKPSPEADRATLLRRLSLDVIGLPPTPAELDDFLADPSPGAYEQQVERLLNSKHFGERWGQLWLDAARYADTDGYEKDKPRTVWFYRDWVVQAFNRDLPYDQFVLEQIAGDLLPQPSQEQIVATGFLRNSMLNEEGGIDPEQFRMESMFDRMDTIGKSVLGLTIQCAQCHDHKYDPLTQKEYYQLFAFLNNDHEAMPVVYSGMEQQQVAQLRDLMAKEESRLQQSIPDWKQRIQAWEASLPKPNWVPLKLVNIGDNAQRYIHMEDGSLLAGGWAPTRFTAKFALTNHLSGITALKVEVLTDPNLPGGGPGRGYDGNFALSELKVQFADLATPDKKRNLAFKGALSDFDQEERELPARFTDGTKNRRVTGSATLAVDGNNNTAWSADRGPGRRNQPTTAIFKLKEPTGSSEGNVFLIDLVQMHGGKNANDYVTKNLGRFRISATSSPADSLTALPADVQDLLNRPASQRNPSDWNRLFRFWVQNSPETAKAAQRLEALWQSWPEGTTAYALKARADQRTTAILKRGDWLKPGDPVQPGLPSFLNASPSGKDSSRLTLARWMTSREAPTTARVFVNRVWQACFGQGLVSTPEDFGIQGDPPSHPELLDWLAVDFMDSGWSVKHLIRRLVQSSTYRQESIVTPALLARDPENRLLARGPRFRVDAEMVRDITLAASGLLHPTMGGPSIMVPAPDFLFKPPASYGDFPWVNETGPDQFRRALYTYRRRSTPFPALTVFDAPPGDFSCVRRQRSNTPLQALTTLNEPLFFEAARALARRTLAEPGADTSRRLAHAFRHCVGRQPDAGELQILTALLERQTQHFASDPAAAQAFSNAQPDEDPQMLAAWTAVARVMLNLDETITKQ